jgi:hypothetical protein
MSQDLARGQSHALGGGGGIAAKLRVHEGIPPGVHAQELRPEVPVDRLTRVEPAAHGLPDQIPLRPEPPNSVSVLREAILVLEARGARILGRGLADCEGSEEFGVQLITVVARVPKA